MKTEKVLKEPLGWTDTLRDMGIIFFSQLKKQCVQKKKFIPLQSDKLPPGKLTSLNHLIAHLLLRKKLINEQELTLQLPLSCYYTILKKRSRKALIFNNVRTVRDIHTRCIDTNTKEFLSLKGKKIGPRVNYETALVLRRLDLLSEKAFLKVPLPSWKTRLLTDKEVGSDGRRKLHRMSWSEDARELIIHAVTLKFREFDGFKRSWHSITLGELVKTFVRINNEGNLVFYTKGHLGSRWYVTEWFFERFENAFKEIQKKLEEFDYLPSFEIT